MRRSLLLASIPVLVVGGGCASVFGIPSDVDERLLVDGSTPVPSVVTPGNEAGVSVGDATSETSAPATKCDPSKPFGAPQKVPSLNTAKPEGEARLNDDERTVFFAVRGDDQKTWTIFTATRAQRTDPFGVPTPFAGLTSTSSEWPCPTDDGKTLLYAGADGLRLFETQNGTTSDVLFSPNIKGAYDSKITPFMRQAAALEVWFASGTADAESYDIFVAKKATDFAAEAVNAVNAPGLNDFVPVISADGLTLYTSRVRIPDVNGKRWFDIWMSRRAKREDSFGESVLLDPLKGGATDDTFVTWISPDDCRIYFHRTTAEDLTTQDIWMAERPLQ